MSGIKVEFPWDEIGDLVEALVTAGASKADAANAVAVWLAESFDFSLILPAPLGVFLEAIDDPLAKSGVAGKLVLAVLKLKIHPFRKRKEAQIP